MLVKEGAAIVGMAIMLALFWKLRPRFATVRNRLVPMALGVVLVLSPWIVRNAIVLKDFIPIRTGYAINWWVANHPGTAQNPDAGDPNHVFTQLEANYPLYNAQLNSLLPANERGRSLVYASEVIRFIRNRPGEYLTLCAKRLWYYVWFVPGHWLASNPVYRLSWIGLLLLAIPGILFAQRLHRLDVVFPLIIVGYLCLYIPVVIVPRYRVIPAMLMLMFASLTVDWLWSRLIVGKSHDRAKS